VETIRYSDLLKRVVSLSQRVYEELSADDNAAIKSYLDTRLKQIWEFYPWPDLTRVEKRYFRLLYNASTSYAAGAEVYYPTEKKYYQAIQSTTGNTPTTLTHWAESKQKYNADLWVAGAAYAAGDIVEYASDGLFYACHTAHTSSGTLIPTATSGNARWGVLTELDKYVAWEQDGNNQIGDVIEVWDADPRTHTKAETENFFQSENGVQVIDGPNIVYIEYRQVVPNIFYDSWVSGTDYKKTNAVRWPTTGADFDLYEAKTVHTASSSNDPGDGTADWGIVNIPRDFRSFLAHGAAADILISDEKERLAGIQQSLADKALADLVDKFERQEGQTRQMRVKIYR
tara:strand:+ start:11185 stop:12213 length:1029 start_codon:yes stop_codon:yes gene_type:complete